MATVEKFKLPPSNFEWLDYKVCTINHILNITDDVLEYKLTRSKLEDETEDRVIYNFRVDLDTLKNHSRFADQSYWTFNSKYSEDQTELSFVELLSIFDLSFPTKRDRVILDTDLDYIKPLRMFVPSVNAKFTDCLFQVADPIDETIPNGPIPEETISWNITVNTTVNSPNTVVDQVRSIRTVIATVTSSTNVTAPAAGSLIPVTVTCSDVTVSKVYLEPVVGVIDRTEVVLTAGTGTFNILTDSLSSGDTVRVKIGHKKYSSVNIFTKQLA